MPDELAPALGGFRADVLPMIDPRTQPLPQNPHTAYVWPTRLCSIGCAHCSFAARRTGPLEARRVAAHPDALIDWLVEAQARRLVVCGGGEPLDEPAFLRTTLRRAAERQLQVELYTAGVSLSRPSPPAETIEMLREASAGAQTPLGVRLSVDAFHEERIGLEPVVDWIGAQERAAPDWRLSLRGIRVEGDDSIARLAQMLGADLSRSAKGTGWMTLPSGRRLLCEWKGFVLENRGSLDVLARRGLRLPEAEQRALATISPAGAGREVGRPFSARLTVTRRRIDLEIHACGTVNILESQAGDLRLRFLDRSWAEIRDAYYRDPLLHRIVAHGLEGIAALVAQARAAGLGGPRMRAFSLQNLNDCAVLNAITALAILDAGPDFRYPARALEAARVRLASVGLTPEASH